jgi:DNA-binding LacI/PurR family transcriptional regulator
LGSDEWAKKSWLKHPSYAAFERELHKHGYSLQVEIVEEADACQWIKDCLGQAGRPDGILIQTGYCTSELAAMLRMYAYPHVSNDFTREHLQINTVCHHATAGIRQMVEHLTQLGHRRMAYIGPANHYRYPMVVSALTALDLPFDVNANCWIEVPRYPETPDRICVYAADAFGDWRRRNPDVTALICANDFVALGVVDAMRLCGLTPGRELSVAGYDNIEEQSATSGVQPMITTINNPFERIGRRMAELLLNQILHGQTAIIHERVPVSLVVRQSTGPVLH